MNQKELLSFINNYKHWYLSEESYITIGDIIPINPKLIRLYQIESVTYDSDETMLFAIETILDGLYHSDAIVMYLVYGDGKALNYYYGLIPNVMSN